MRCRAVRMTAIGALAAASVVVTAPAAPAAERPGAPPGHVLTLITGDRVEIPESGGGREYTVLPGPGRAGIPMLRRSEGGRLLVVPADAAPLVARGVLDKRLFDVTSLVKAGFADAPDVPVIVQYRPGLAAAPLAAATTKRVLPSVHGAALRTPDAQAGQFWTSLVHNTGVAKVWLDGRSHPLDDASNTQIGVPTAWQAGLTGKGVTVAVLDTGYDATHPDLAGVVAGAKDFTDSTDGTTDTVGHGTHVSGIIAGSGTASAGRYRGVAPDAKLLEGRVCEDESCDDSAILAGMEWAAGQHAKVISLSLGSDDPSDGTDPLSAAVDSLTASSGSLFVIAAGNTGKAASIGAPGAAAAALTVGSVGRTDVVSDFSSRGPRIGDDVVKPDLTAPGEGIIAPRAAGTSMGDPVDDHYTAASGTSMATPQVSGAAAILAQAHPDWTAAQLKDALMSTSAPVADTVYGAGAGRVDIGRAVTQTVHGESGSADFGLLHWPYATGQPKTSKLVYRNDGDAPVTLALAGSATGPDGKPAAAGAFTLPATVTVPAHGSASADLVEHPDHLGTTVFGSFGGRVTATAPGVTVRTAFGVTTEPESYDVSVQVIDRNGAPGGVTDEADVSFTLLDQRSGAESPDDPVLTGGKATVRIPKGAYAVSSVVISEDPAHPGLANASGTVAAVPSLTVDHAGISLVFDARQGKQAQAVVDAPNPVRVDSQAVANYQVKTDSGIVAASVGISGGAGNPLYAVPVRGDAATFAFGFQEQLTAPGRAYFLAFPFIGRIPADLRLRVRDRDLHAADSDYHTLGVPAAVADRVEFVYFLPGQDLASSAFVPATLPSRRTEFYSPGVRFSGHILQQYLPTGNKGLFEGQVDTPDTVYRAGTHVRQEWNDAVAAPSLTSPTSWIRRSGNTLAMQVSSYSPGEANHTGDATSDFFSTSGSSVLTRDGKEVGHGLPSIGSFTLPGDTGRYTLTLQSKRTANWASLATAVTTAWTFTSDASQSFPPLPTVKTTGTFDGLGRAKASAPFTLCLDAATQRASSAITGLTVDVSADDGVTWHPAAVARDHGQWLAKVTNPASGFVSVRVKAANAAGNTVEQTTIRAYGIA